MFGPQIACWATLIYGPAVPRLVLPLRGVAAGSSLLTLLLASPCARTEERRAESWTERAAGDPGEAQRAEPGGTGARSYSPKLDDARARNYSPKLDDAGASSYSPKPDDAGARSYSPKPDDARARSYSPKPDEPPVGAHQKRSAVDYDGRGAAPTSTGKALLWVPRILLSPLYLVSEYVVRRPLGWIVTAAEREQVPTLILDFFTFGPDRTAGIIPTALIDFGFRPSIGVYFFYDEAFHPDNHLRARAAWGGPDWLLLHATERVDIDSDRSVSLKGRFARRPDLIYHGEGPTSSDDDRGRYFSQSLGGWIEYRLGSWHSSTLRANVGVRNVRYDAHPGCCGDPSVGARVTQGAYPEPTAINDGFFVLEQSVDLTLDTRWPRNQAIRSEASDFESPSGTGVRVDLRAFHATSFDRRPPLAGAAEERFHWLRYGATLGSFLDLTGQQRTLGLSLVVDFADPLLKDGAIPFDELATLGGARPLSGLLDGRLRGRSTAAAVFEYTWPIWVWLDGSMHYAVGNAFGPELDGFEADLLRSSFGVGIKANTQRDHSFQMLLAFGTEPFDQGAHIESVRFVLGAADGF